MIYLDSAATTLQKPWKVGEATRRAVNRLGSPGRGGHRAVMRAAETAYECREELAALLGAKGAENVVFTMNATHALNIGIKSLIKPGMRVLISGYEHNSVLRPLKAIGARVSEASARPFDAEGIYSEFERLAGEADAVVFNHVSNVFGFILPAERIAALCRERGLPFMIDASQSAGVLDIDFAALGADFLALPGHKGLYGPQGTGVLLCRSGGEPLMEGGTGSNSRLPDMPDFLPDRLEAGTHNMPGIAGLLEGVRFVRGVTPRKIRAREKMLSEAAERELERINYVRIYTAPHGTEKTGVLSFNAGDIPCERMAAELGRRGVAVRAGLHCSPAAHRSAGTGDTGTVRLSVSVFNTRREIWRAAEIIEDILKKLK